MSKCEPTDLTDCQWTKMLWSTIPVGLLITGTFGNILNIVVLSRQRLRTFSTSVYLICLSFGDCTFLWLGMGPRILLQGFDKDVKSDSDFLCKVINWLPVTAGGYSVWIIVLMTLERVLLTRWPVSAKSKLTRKNTIIAVIVMLVFCFSLTSHVPFVARLHYVFDSNGHQLDNLTQCLYIYGRSANFYREVWPLVVLVVFNVVPMVIIIVGNLTIVVTIISQRRKMRRVNPASQDQQHSAPKKIKSATKMLFLVSAVFVLTTLPFTIGNVILSLKRPTTTNAAAEIHLIYTVLRIILYCNYTFNFVLYFVSGTLFKQEWKAMIYDVRMRIVRLFLPQEIPSEHQNTNTASTYPSDQPNTSGSQNTRPSKRL